MKRRCGSRPQAFSWASLASAPAKDVRRAMLLEGPGVTPRGGDPEGGIDPPRFLPRPALLPHEGLGGR
jgi:hypothetical protein